VPPFFFQLNCEVIMSVFGKSACRNSVCAALLAAASAPALAQKTDAEIAKAAQNPIAAMISVPLQYNYDHNIGPREDGHKNYLNVQPVIPFSIGEDWNLISRTIVPVVAQENIVPGTGHQAGIGDTTQSLFFSPKKPTDGGMIWGAGPVLLLRTATNDLLGGEKWGVGPTAVFLKQEHGFTYGALVNHIWSVAGNSNRADISSTFLQPFVSYTTQSHTTFAINTESTYNWKTNDWSVPVHFMVKQLVKVGDQRLQLEATARRWVESAENGPHGWGARFAVTFLFPN
jgi:hypothetical protein